MALEKVDGVAGAFVDAQMNIFLSKDVELNETTLNATLEPFNIKVYNVTKSPEAAF